MAERNIRSGLGSGAVMYNPDRPVLHFGNVETWTPPSLTESEPPAKVDEQP